MNTHECKLLNAFLGKTVKVTFKDNSTYEGVLEKSSYRNWLYKVGVLCFAKSCVKKVEFKG